MKQVTLFLVALLFVCSTIHAQENIFKKHGVTKEPLTLSKGKYKETFYNEEIMQIGTVLINTQTEKVIRFLDEDSTKYAYKAETTSRFLTVDPLAEKYYSWSPYVYVGNNPIIRTDPTGMDWYIFDEESGEYKEKQDAKGTHRMAIRSVDKKGNISYKFHDFNDPKDDAANIDAGNITKFSTISSNDIESFMQNADVYDQTSLSRWGYALTESNANNTEGSGKLDFRATVPQIAGNDRLQIINGTAYNNADAGNYLWGYAMRKMGLEEITALSAAHANAWWSAKQSNGQGSQHSNSMIRWFQNRSWGGDSSGDQRAIKKGMRDAGSVWKNVWRVFKKNFE
ncbi:MAG: polymorphic toxin type 44 domain-containing protein [Dysgonomonas mossii]|uniref:polymorphic toxin type 44 domain-containing protein n=1 Tax=Dysgonomonas mossii TaxID=163665 RepID=UPI0039939595